MHTQLSAEHKRGAAVSEQAEDAPAPEAAPEAPAPAAEEAPAEATPVPVTGDVVRVVVYSSRQYEVELFENTAAEFKQKGINVVLDLIEAPLNVRTASFAKEATAVCAFVNDDVGTETIQFLRNNTSVRIILMRCAGFNNVDLAAAGRCEIAVVRVPEYSPYAVAEHSVALAMSLNRKIHRAYTRNRDLNFSLVGLLGFDMRGKTVGIVGTGKIGIAAANIYLGFGCKVVAQSRSARPELVEKGVEYMSIEELCKVSDIISLHAPLTKGTKYCINRETISVMKDGVMIINTSRGALLETSAALEAIKSGKIGALGLDVYENESDIFFNDHTGEILEDDVFTRLVNYPNVLVTGHQGFLTREAISSICAQTLGNLQEFVTAKESGTAFADLKLKNGIVATDVEIAEDRTKMASRAWGALKRLQTLRMYYDSHPDDTW